GASGVPAAYCRHCAGRQAHSVSKASHVLGARALRDARWAPSSGLHEGGDRENEVRRREVAYLALTVDSSVEAAGHEACNDGGIGARTFEPLARQLHGG